LYEVDNKSITHRPDLWGQYGMAREVAAMLGRPLQPLALDVAFGSGAPLQLQVQAPQACSRYVCARIQGVQIAPAPVDVRLLLRRLGVRPINNAVDATNLVMLETGNPLHAFDARQVRGDQIVVRKAVVGETLQTLDGQIRQLTSADLLICDGEGPVALAGIMGGQDSEIKDDTAEIVLEAAAFESAAIRKTSMRLGMRTDASARFEKALDPALASVAARRFLRCLLKWSPGAVVTSDLLDGGTFAGQPPQPTVVHTTVEYLRTRLGVSDTEMPTQWVQTCLERLGFAVAIDVAGNLQTTVPTWRATKDIRRPEDLVEELGRHYGYGNIRSQAPLIPSRPPYLPAAKKLGNHLRQVLSLGQGLTEVQLYAFDHEGHRRRLGLSEGLFGSTASTLPRSEVQNEIAVDHKFLRRSLLPNLLACVEGNLLRGDGVTPAAKGMQVAQYELGRVFLPVAAGYATEQDDSGLPAVAHLPHDHPQRQAWWQLLDEDVRDAVL
jgi:phenylalanyl-tRNA synthetase beta chain